MTKGEASHLILLRAQEQLMRSAVQLEKSFKKSNKISLSNCSEGDLEVLDAFTSRFARTSDILVRKVLRLLFATQEVEAGTTIVDLLNFAEKHSLIESAKAFLDMRELRNEIAHEYSNRDFEKLIRDVLEFTPKLLDAAKKASVIVL